MTWRVLISAPKFLSAVEEFRSRLEAAGIELVIVPVRERLSESELLAVVETIDGAICGDDQFTEKVMRAAPRLRVISKWGTGIDSIDTRAAAQLGIRVCNTTNAFTNAVADTTMGYILSFARGLLSMDRDVRLGLWTKPNLLSLSECTLGVVGVGNIGKAVVHRARAFGTRVIGRSRHDIAARVAERSRLCLASLRSQSYFVPLNRTQRTQSDEIIGIPDQHGAWSNHRRTSSGCLVTREMDCRRCTRCL
jgi:D-3-phosphoglycerate dehydrogenase